MHTLMSSLGLSKSWPKILCCCLPSTWLNELRLCYARFWTTPPRCSMTLKTKCSSCPSSGSSLSIRELLNTASRNRPSRDSELSRAASGLVKVLCKPNDSTAGGKGSHKGKPLKQGGALAKFNDWFESMSLMNTLYVWFPASSGPSVVQATSKRNQTWLQQHPVHRDPAMFNASEVENGPASREMSVDWMALQDSELTQQFEILREGILRDVFSQRASSAWQGMQPQRLTVSLLLPGGGTADHAMAGFPAVTASVLADYDHPACLLGPHSHAYLPT